MARLIGLIGRRRRVNAVLYWDEVQVEFVSSFLPTPDRYSAGSNGYLIALSFTCLIANRATIALFTHALMLLGDQHHCHGGVVVEQVEKAEPV